jgi:hypothetical protein
MPTALRRFLAALRRHDPAVLPPVMPPSEETPAAADNDLPLRPEAMSFQQWIDLNA